MNIIMKKDLRDKGAGDMGWIHLSQDKGLVTGLFEHGIEI
jgi:hypothetical protein